MEQTLSAHIEKLWPLIAQGTREHLFLTLVAMLIATAIALPLGIALTRAPGKVLPAGVLAGVAALQTVPSLALISLIVLVFALIGMPTVGIVPALVALIAYALLPILRNTFTGIRQVDPALTDVSRAMGMTGMQTLTRVELPLALPVIMAGVRIATVWTVGVATLCGLIGAGGLGDLIIRGLRSIQLDLLLAGTLPAAALALALDWLLGRVERFLTPPGLRR